jgi:outer membrane protein OmpA-like peptidoglycan-associated protein
MIRRNLVLRLGFALILAALPAAPLAAQIAQGGQVDLGVLGTYTKYDSNVGLTSAVGAGGRLGFFLSGTFALEARGDFTRTDATADLERVDLARVGGTFYAYGPHIVGSRFYLGAGYTRSYYRGALDIENDGGHAILGTLLSLGGRTALRLEGRLDFIPSSKTVDPAARAINLGAAAGLSIFAFGGPPRDSDGDGVHDGLDRCADTPRGAVVDDTGCALDTDADAVPDGLDRCPGTPAGAVVDSGGCPTDTDEDAVPDGIDVCPNTPAGARVDEFGCPLDTDTDGVFDGLDQCPNTPPGAIVDGTGCPIDSDADGVADGLDRCPNTPEGVRVDADGCALDSDQDGVHDGLDRCPNTPPSTEVDGTGCRIQEVVEEAVPRAPLILRGVSFETGRSALTEESYAVLDEIAASLLAHPEVRIEISGHTDNTGSRSTNMRLSGERARAVRAYLAQKGVDPSRMDVLGVGPDRPIATNATADGRAQNRRVELRRIDQEP